MATIREVYKLLKQKKATGEKIRMFGESFIEAFEEEKETPNTREVHVSFIKNKDDNNK